jgi:hypothetical protein
MRRSASLLVSVGVLLVACSYQPFVGGNPSVPPSVDPESPVVGEPQSPGPDPSGDGSLREEPNADVVDAHPTGIDHFAIGADGRTVIVYFWGGTPACFALQRVEIDTDADGATVVTVYEGTLPEAVGQACTMEAVLKSTVVTLDQPIVSDAANPGAPAGEPELVTDAEVVDLVTGTENPVPVAITGYQVTADGLTLTAQFYGGVPECYGVASASVDASSAPVVVSLSEGHIPTADVCIEIAVAKAFAFTLEQPLILDGTLDA